jgi:hypothetical protein
MIVTCENCEKRLERRPSAVGEHVYCSVACRSTDPAWHKRAGRAKVTVACEGCGKELRRAPSAIRDHVYCSQACRTIRRKRTCAREGCEVEFVPRKSQPARYCSRRCAAHATQALRRTGHHVPCPICGTLTYYAPSRIANGARYCSPACYHVDCRKGPAPEPRLCPGCYEEFTPRFPAFTDRQFCSLECWGRYRRDERPETLVPLFRTFSPKLRQTSIGRLLGKKAGRRGGRPPVQLSDAQLDQVRRLAKTGWGRRAIASHLAVSEQAVRKALAHDERGDSRWSG